MAIREPIKLSWKGKKHRLIVTMLIIQRVNSEIGLMNLSKFDPKNFDFVKISLFYYILFDECGFFSADHDNDIEWLNVYDVIFAASDDDKREMFKEYALHTAQFLPNLKAPVAKKKTKRKKKPK